MLSACSHFSKSDEGEQLVSGNTAGGDSEGLSEDAKGAILGGTIGATPGMIALGLAAAGTCSNPFTIAVCPLALGLAAGLTATGAAAGATIGYHAKTTNDYVVQDSGNAQATTGSVSTVISGQVIGQPLDAYNTKDADMQPVAETESAVMAAMADTETSDEPAEVITNPVDDPDDINAYLFFKGEEKIFASIKKIAGIFNREAE